MKSAPGSSNGISAHLVRGGGFCINQKENKQQTLESPVHSLVQSQDDIQPILKGRLESNLFLFIGSLIWLAQLWYRAL